jgi:glutathione S-transferase
MIEDLCDPSFDAVGFGFWLAELRKEAPESQAMKRAAADELRQLLAVLEGELGESDFFCGEISLADLAAICYVPGAKTMGVHAAEFKRLQALDRADAPYSRGRHRPRPYSKGNGRASQYRRRIRRSGWPDSLAR